jgi:hypothetical protein
MPARAQRIGASDERDERPFPRIVHNVQTGVGLDADREHWVRYPAERARNALRERDPAEIDRRFIASHPLRRAAGEEEARGMSWLDQVTTSLAEGTGVDARDLELDAETRRAILDVARVASHSSGERIYAPLLCYVLGILSSRGVPLDSAISIVEETAGS